MVTPEVTPYMGAGRGQFSSPNEDRYDHQGEKQEGQIQAH